MPNVPSRLSRRALLRALALGSAVALPVTRLGRLAAQSRAAGVSDAPAPATLSDEDGSVPLRIPADIGEDEQWVDVNLTQQAAVGMIGREWTRVALVTTGMPGWETPEGQFRIVRRVANETMTSASLGITDPNDFYVLTDVLYTQYFTWEGHALHLNYWRPDSVFGSERTSHGCVGMRLANAEYFWSHLTIGSRVVVHS